MTPIISCRYKLILLLIINLFFHNPLNRLHIELTHSQCHLCSSGDKLWSNVSWHAKYALPTHNPTAQNKSIIILFFFLKGNTNLRLTVGLPLSQVGDKLLVIKVVSVTWEKLESHPPSFIHPPNVRNQKPLSSPY